MQSYRTAFLVTVATAVLLAGAVGFLWLHPRRVSALPPRTANSAVATDTSGESPPSETTLSPVALTPQRLQSIGVKTGLVAYRNLRDEIRTVGNVDVDETRVSDVQVRFSGWVQKVYADATYQQVHKGQPLLTVYSPDLVTTEQEYLLARDNRSLLLKSTVPGVASGATSLLSAAADRLKQWGLPDREISDLEKTGEVRRELEIDSPVSGFITERKALPNMYVQPGTNLYSVADLSSVWVYAQVFQEDLGRVRVGNPASITVDAYPGRVFTGRVSFIWPELDQTTRTARVRLQIPNLDLRLSLGMFVNVTIVVPVGRRLSIPASAVYQTGTRQIAFVDRGGGHFEPREIQIGPQAGDDVAVLKGLAAGERIVTSANFLMDSESQLQAALGSFVPPPPGAGAAAAMNGSHSRASLEYSSIPAIPHKGSNTFRVKLMDRDGASVSGAQVTVTYFMPAMPAMSMPAMRTVTTLSEKGGGLYEGTGQVETGGTWQVTVLATKDGQTIAQKQISVAAVGGM
ncbi:MAG TPA: efflux RND transporter periplasmic adaptor subunit [Bryobacteraceae bacterium]|nr:efflux RND transporter periplasmic adaptor subunit [Bryobacteraceae bacterium]